MSIVGHNFVLLSLLGTSTPWPDNLQVQWGSQDHYEIVRKVGRGKYSEVRGDRSSLVFNLKLATFGRSSKVSTSSMTRSV